MTLIQCHFCIHFVENREGAKVKHLIGNHQDIVSVFSRQCLKCSQLFPSIAELLKHLSFHEETNICPLCNQASHEKYTNNFIMHYRLKHCDYIKQHWAQCGTCAEYFRFRDIEKHKIDCKGIAKMPRNTLNLTPKDLGLIISRKNPFSGKTGREFPENQPYKEREKPEVTFFKVVSPPEPNDFLNILSPTSHDLDLDAIDTELEWLTSKPKPFQCVICGQAFEVVEEFRKHLERHLGRHLAWMECPICGNTGNMKVDESVQDVIRFTCQFCLEMNKSKTNAIRVSGLSVNNKSNPGSKMALIEPMKKNTRLVSIQTKVIKKPKKKVDTIPNKVKFIKMPNLNEDYDTKKSFALSIHRRNL